MLTHLTTGIQHIGIPTNNLEETTAFYEGLGFCAINRTENAGEQVAFLQLHNLVIETYQNSQAVHKNGAIDHIAIDVVDLQTVYDAVVKSGYSILEEIQFLPFWENGVQFFKIIGPNSEVIELCQKL